MRRFRNRPLETSGLLLLSALLTAVVCFVPLYDAAMQQEATTRQLAQAPGFVTDLRITSTTEPDFFEPLPALAPEELEQLVPDSIRPHYSAPVSGWTADATIITADRRSSGKVLSRPGQCQVLTLTEGVCPSRPGDVLVSRDDQETFGFRVGETVRAAGTDGADVQPNGLVEPVPRTVTLQVVGAYDAAAWHEPSHAWAGQRLGGLSGTVDPGPPTGLFHDAWITDASTFTSRARTPLPVLSSYVGLALDRDGVGADEVTEVADAIARLSSEVTMRTDADLQVESTITTIADNVEAQASQARVTVPILMGQLALLCLVVLWLALRAAVEERRPAVALVRLRGRRRAGARRFLVRDLLPVLLAGVLPGAALGVLGCALLQRWLMSTEAWLPGLGVGFLLAVALAVLVMGATVLLLAHRTSLEPAADLLRRVPARRSPWRLGALAAVVVAAAGSALAAILSGGTRGPAALAVPALLAVVVGVLLAYLSGPVVGLLGRWLLRRGRLVGSVALLSSARSGTAARTVAMVTVAAGLSVFAVNALAVGDHNWTAAAAHRAGAAVALPVSGGRVAQLRAVAAEADPSGEHVTPVVRITSPGTNAPGVLAVLPDSFPQVALFPAGAPPSTVWDDLRPDEAEPVRLTGRRGRVRLEVGDLRARDGDGAPVPVDLWAVLRTDEGRTSVVVARDLTPGTTRPRFELPCTDECILTGFVLRTVPGSPMAGRMTVAHLRAGGVPVPLDPVGGWRQTSTGDATVRATVVGDGLRVDVEARGIPAVELSSAWLPTSVPVLATEALTHDAPATMEGVSGLSGLDGLRVPADLAAEIEHVPASGDLTMVANLEALERLAPGRTDAAMELWMDSPSQMSAVEAAASRHGLEAGNPRARDVFGEELRGTSAAWSLQLALVAGAAGLLIAALALVVVSVSRWRTVSRDLAALRVAGLSARSVRRVAVVAQLPAIVVGVLVGTATGVLSARIAMPVVPLFATEPEVSLLDLDLAWWPIAVASGVSLVVLTSTGILAGGGVARRSRPERLREAV